MQSLLASGRIRHTGGSGGDSNSRWLLTREVTLSDLCGRVDIRVISCAAARMQARLRSAAHLRWQVVADHCARPHEGWLRVAANTGGASVPGDHHNRCLDIATDEDTGRGNMERKRENERVQQTGVRRWCRVPWHPIWDVRCTQT